MPRVLSVTSECVPFLKTGGLADVAGALPGALNGLGWDMKVLMPGYRALTGLVTKGAPLWSDPDLFGGPAKIVKAQQAGAEVLLLIAPHLFDRDGGPYGDGQDFRDNPQRFAALCWAAAEVARKGLKGGWTPDLVHAHDWQAGLLPAYLKLHKGRAVPSVLTVHNIAFQGLAPAALLRTLKLPAKCFAQDGVEYWGQIGALKAGLIYADTVTTVSPTYANELMRPEFGMGLDGVVSMRAGDLHGILNGIDPDIWDPASDPEILPFSTTSMKGKKTNRDNLLKQFGLGRTPGPLAIVVSRLTHQKGIDILIDAAPAFLDRGGSLAVLGTGEPELEARLKRLAQHRPEQVGVHIGYDEALSHRMFGGGDAVLVPSRFEPCGLTQMYGLRYGAVPLVAATGGLADTVIDANPAALSANAATGVQFHPIDAMGLAQAFRRLCDLYDDRRVWTALQKRGMKQDLGWDKSAAEYAKLYESLLT